MSIPAKVGESVTLAMVLDDGATGLFPQVEVYAGAALQTTIDLSDLGKGRYEGSWTPASVGTYSALFCVYEDAGHTVELSPFLYSREIEQVFVTQSDIDDLAAEIVRLLGLNLENTFIDNTTYDADSMMLTGRLRVFDSRANALAATEGGVGETGTIAEYNVESTHFGPNRVRTMRMVKD